MAASSSKRDARTFVIDTIVVAVTQLIIRARGILLLPVLIKSLGTASYGVWAQVVALATFLTAIVCLNFHLPLVREVAADRSRSAVVYTTLMVATVAISAVSVIALGLVPGPIAVLLLDSSDAADYVRLGLLLMFLANVRLLNTNLYRALDRLVLRSVVEVVAAIGEIVAIVAVIAYGGSLEDVLLVMVAWSALVAVPQTIHCFWIAGVGRPSWSIVRAAVAYAIPLIPASFANFALDRIDRFVVGHYLGAAGVGVYSANYALGALIMLVQAPLQMTLFPKVSELWDRDRAQAGRYLNASTAVFVTFAIPFIVGVAHVATPMLTALGNGEIAAGAGATTLYIAAGVAFWGLASIQSQVFYGARRTVVWGAITITATFVNLGANIVLVPNLGVDGAALATLVAYAGTWIAAAVLSRPILRTKIDLAHVAACGGAAAVMGAALTLIDAQGTGSLLVEIGAAVVVYGIALGAFRRVLPRGEHDISARGLIRLLRR